jgi:hypothetical protein
MNGVAAFDPRNLKIKRLEEENARLQMLIAHAYEALRDGRRGEALALLRPKTISAPLPAIGERA